MPRLSLTTWSPRRPRRNEGGATAVLVGVVAFVLLMSSAFAVDFGLAFVDKRRLQNASDAAALAAAYRLAQVPGSCATILTRNGPIAQAQNVADSIREENRANSEGSDLELSCSSRGTLLVEYTSSRTVQTVLAVVGGNEEIPVSRAATAEVYRPAGAAGVRPYAVCTSELTGLDSNPVPRVIYFPSPTCGPDPNSPGNWYTIDCPTDDPTNSGTPELAANILNGCDEFIYTYPPTNAIEPTLPVGDPVLTTMLPHACDDDPGSVEPDCISGNPGNMPATALVAAWNTLLGKEIMLPVFYPQTMAGSGTNAEYPVYRLLAARVCGFRFQSNVHSGLYTGGTCAGAAHPSPTPSGPGAPKDWLILVPEGTLLTGATASGGGIANSGRAVRLLE